MKGLALVGALIGFAEHPRLSITRWASVAGTSAGAIVASLLAAGHGVKNLEELMRKAPYEKFEDTGAGGRIVGGALNLVRHHGLAHGEYFRRWLDEQVAQKTFAAVREADGSFRLRLIAADITRHEMLVLPEDLGNYRAANSEDPIRPEDFKIADAVRMSMSIPYFFQPVELVHHATGLSSTIVDGGVLSNFPVWLFDVSNRQPVKPTFGLRLVGGRGVGGGLQKVIEGLGWPIQTGTNIVHTATDAWDTRFMTHSTAVRTCPVPAGDVGTTDFNLTPAQQAKLVDGGRVAALKFLDDFQVEQYVNTFGHRLSDEAPARAAAVR